MTAFLWLAGAGGAAAQNIVADHTSVAHFARIPAASLQSAASLSMMFVDRSVGWNISEGLTCLGYASDEAAPNSCKRYRHPVPTFSSPQSEVNWSRAHNRGNWHYYGWPGVGISPELPCGVATGMWHEKLNCFIRWVDANPGRYRVVGFQFSYLEVADTSDIASPVSGFFVAQPNKADVTDLDALRQRHPNTIFVMHTTSLARGIGTQVSTDFNEQMREYAQRSGLPLLDVADIEAHDPWGNPCYDNRDGVPYVFGTRTENHPDDGLQLPAVCQHYTPELEGGHLGNPDVGKIRIAKAFWVLMAQLTGWRP